MRARAVAITLITIAAALVFGGFIAQLAALQAESILSRIFH